MDVGSWLQSLGLGQYEALFRDNDIDAEVLCDLTDADLEKLGVLSGIASACSRRSPVRLRGASRDADEPFAPTLSTDAPNAVRSRSCSAISSARRV